MCVCVTWKVCWGCSGPRLHSDPASCSHHAVGSESRSEAYGFLLDDKRVDKITCGSGRDLTAKDLISPITI